MVSREVEPAASSDEGLHETGGDAGVFAGFGAGGVSREILCQFMLGIPDLPEGCARRLTGAKSAGGYEYSDLPPVARRGVRGVGCLA